MLLPKNLHTRIARLVTLSRSKNTVTESMRLALTFELTLPANWNVTQQLTSSLLRDTLQILVREGVKEEEALNM